MRDLIGTTLGHYRIAEKIGAGGMGVVYRAYDERLDRDVAVKVLPEEVADDPDRLARFEREAKLLASLSHQNIATLHGLEEHEGQRFLVMEFVEGENLAERIKKGPLTIDDALDYARQIAEALEAAHEQGIIHRDLKPANVMLSPEGRVKVLDFGLAKAWQPEEGDADLTHSPTLTAQMTAAGVLLGTAAYMSPEQARGKPVDKRTDVWSFGCVLFEMLTGSRCHQGETVSDTLAGILMQAPTWESLPASTPPRVHRLLRRCLGKDPQRRLRDIGEARIALEDFETLAVSDGRDDAAGRSQTSKRPWRALPWVIVAATAAAAVAVGWVTSRPEPPRAPTRLAVDLPSDLRLSITLSNPLAVSPDGSRLAFVASRGGARPRLYLRELSRFGASSIPGTEGADGPFFSPDGQWIAFFTDKKLRKVSVLGGAPLDICDAMGATDHNLTTGWGWCMGALRIVALWPGGTPLPTPR
jgi:serine/threonine protein kinase